MKTSLLGTAAILAAVVVSQAANAASEVKISGQASVIYVDTIEIGHAIALGISAPESKQLCRGDNSETYNCGARATSALAAWIGGRVVTCLADGFVDHYGRWSATCSVDGADIGEWLVSSGWALAWQSTTYGRYWAAQQEAERAKRGMWSGSFVKPWDYQKCAGPSPSAERIAYCSDEARPKPARRSPIIWSAQPPSGGL